MKAEEFLQLLLEGGAITSAGEYSLEEIEIARAEDRFYIDSSGNAYIWDSFE